MGRTCVGGTTNGPHIREIDLAKLSPRALEDMAATDPELRAAADRAERRAERDWLDGRWRRNPEITLGQAVFVARQSAMFVVMSHRKYGDPRDPPPLVHAGRAA